MTQIILDGIPLPEASNSKYAAWEELLSVQIEMISGRMVSEIRGKVWRATWSYDYLDNDMTKRILAVLRSGKPFVASILPDNGGKMISSMFLVENQTRPTFLCSDNGDPIWHGLAFTIREVNPHD